MYFILFINKNITPTRQPTIVLARLPVPKMSAFPAKDEQDLAARWLTVERAMVTPVVQAAEAPSGHMAMWEGWTKFLRLGYGSTLISQGPPDTEPLWQSEDQGRGVPVPARLNVSHLVFQPTALLPEFTVSGSLAYCEINTLTAPWECSVFREDSTYTCLMLEVAHTNFPRVNTMP